MNAKVTTRDGEDWKFKACKVIQSDDGLTIRSEADDTLLHAFGAGEWENWNIWTGDRQG